MNSWDNVSSPAEDTGVNDWNVVSTPQPPRLSLRPPVKRKAVKGSSIVIVFLSVAVVGLLVFTGLNVFHIVNFNNAPVIAGSQTNAIVSANETATAIVSAAYATATAQTATAPTASSNAQPSGTYLGNICPTTYGFFVIVNAVTGLVMDDSGASLKSGTAILQYPYGASNANGVTNQQWQFFEAGTNNFKIKNALSDLFLDESNGGIVQNADNGGLSQQWQCIPTGNNYFKIVNANSSLVLDVTNTNLTEIGYLVADSYTGALHQQWLFVSPS